MGAEFPMAVEALALKMLTCAQGPLPGHFLLSPRTEVLPEAAVMCFSLF